MGRGSHLTTLREATGIMDAQLDRMLRLNQAKPIANYNVGRHLDLYMCYVNGFSLVFLKCHGFNNERAYRLDDNLAKVLGFPNIQRLKEVLPIRKSRQYLTVTTLRRAINRYALRSSSLLPYPNKVKCPFCGKKIRGLD